MREGKHKRGGRADPPVTPKPSIDVVGQGETRPADEPRLDEMWRERLRAARELLASVDGNLCGSAICQAPDWCCDGQPCGACRFVDQMRGVLNDGDHPSHRRPTA